MDKECEAGPLAGAGPTHPARAGQEAVCGPGGPPYRTIRVEANGIQFEVFEAGGGDRLAVCLHGFPDHAISWRHQMPLLARLGYRVWAPNLRGYGTTDSPREVAAYHINVLVDDVAALIRASGAREALVLAHDWGGALAWTLAMREPSLIERLVVCNLPHPACYLREVKRPAQFLRSWYIALFQVPWLPEALLRFRGGRGAVEMILRTSRDRSRFPRDVCERYRHNASRPGGATAMLNWYRALVRNGAWREHEWRTFPKIEIPTLLIWGREDVALDFRTTQGTDAYVSNLSLRVLPGVSHWVQREAPEAVNAMIEAWLAGAPVPEADSDF